MVERIVALCLAVAAVAFISLIFMVSFIDSLTFTPTEFVKCTCPTIILELPIICLFKGFSELSACLSRVCTHLSHLPGSIQFKPARIPNECRFNTGFIERVE